jgi:uncharacterized coiled-coil protein SlyX
VNELEQRIARLEQQLAHAMQLIDDLTYDTKIPDVEDRRERRVAIEKYKAQGMSGNAARKAAHREMYRR